jgi:2,4-dienoyl-CoA reductase-like NADH-dependent reductase (Old Yellow Enzyme family)
MLATNHQTQNPSNISTSLCHYLAWPLQGTATAAQYPLTPLLRKLFSEASHKGNPVDFNHYQTTEHVPTEALQNRLVLPNGYKIHNRLVKTGITDGLCSERGDPTQAMIQAYQQYATGGYGMIISPDVSIARQSPLPCATGHTPIFDKQSDHAAFKLLAQTIKSGGSAAILQLTHPGTVVAYANQAKSIIPAIANHPRGGFSQYAHVLTNEEIDKLFETFAIATRQAEDCEFNGIQLVLANGYLPTQFFSSQHTRKGKWKGISFLRKLLPHLVQNKQSPTFTIGIKVNSEDFKSGGIPPHKAAGIVRELSKMGIDFIEIGGGNCENLNRQTTTQTVGNSERETFFQEFSKALSRMPPSIPILATGDWRSIQAMNTAASENENLLIGLGRPVCIDPLLGNKILSGRIEKIPNWFTIYFPTWLKPESKKTNPDRKMLYGIEVVWHASAVASTARGENPPHVVGILDDPVHALAVKTHMLVRAVVPRQWLSSYYRQNPWIQAKTDQPKGL